ncbi:MAG: hypothetical protein ABIS47_08115 [Acidimicrobiales bacterium]
MPSLIELLEDGTGEASAPSGPPEVLASVKAEGGRRRLGRRRRTAALALLGLVLIAGPAVAVRADDGRGRREVTVAADGAAPAVDSIADPVALPLVEAVPPPTLPAAEPPLPVATTTPPTTAPPLAATVTTTPTTAPTTTAPATTTPTTTAPVCRDSREPACGPFAWDPGPAANQPLTVSFTNPPVTAVAGRSVTFEVAWADPDAALSFDQLTIDGTSLTASCSLAPRYGPWTPPAAVPGGGTRSYPTVFPAAGTYRVVASLSTSNCSSPYSNDAQAVTMVEVTAPPAG